MKGILSILIFLSLFFQSCTAWPLLTGTLGLVVGKKGDGVSLLPFFLQSSDPVITRIELSSEDTSIARGMSAALQVTAIYDNGTNNDITNSASVVSDIQSVAAIQENRVRGIAPGSSLLQVEYNGFHTQLKIEVTPAILNSIQVDSLDSGSLPKGLNRQFSAIGIFSDGSHQDLSNDPLTIWSTSDASLARVNNSGAVSGINLGIAHIQASFGSKQGSSPLTVSPATLSSIQVTPADLNLPLGKKRQLTATGIYSDNSNRDISSSVVWDVSDPTIVSVQPQGLLETINIGTAAVSASFGSKVGSTKLTVTPASLVSISVSPVNSSAAKGLSQSFTATGIFSDNSNSDITNQVTWTSSDTNILGISNANGSRGLASALNHGAVTVTASVGGIEGFTDFAVTQATLVSISVTPVLPSKAKGLTEQFTATGTFTDHSKRDITASVTWTSSSGAASVSNVHGNEGLGQTLSIGNTTVTATMGKVSGNTTFTVTPAVLTAIQIGPIHPSLTKGLRKKFSATGIYSDNSNSDITSSVTWFSSDSSVSVISNAAENKGTASGNTIGNTDIKATLGNISSPISTLSVTAAELVSIGITPASSSKAKGLKENFKATGVFTDNSTQDLTEQVTWNSSDTAVAEIVNAVGNKGLTNSLVAGSSYISAVLGSVTSPNVSFTVTPAQLVSIAVTPNGASVAKGLTKRFHATGTYTDNSVQDVTDLVSWSSSNPGKASVSSAANSEGLTTAISAGNTNITATLGVISGSSALDVTSAILTSIEVTPSLPSIAKGLTKRFSATGIYSDNSTQDLTSAVTWVSSDSSKVAIENSVGKKGSAVASTLGSSNITAIYNSIRSAPTPMTVTAAELESISISPDFAWKAKGLTQQFIAEGIFTDNSRQDITDLATWYSSDSKIAPISNADGKKGLVNALSEGGSAISAVYNSLNSNSINFNVNPATLVSIEIKPDGGNIIKGLTRQYAALGVYSDASTQDITDFVSWGSSDPLSVFVDNGTSKGLAKAWEIGTYTISASLASITGSADLNVGAAPLSSIAVSPTDSTVNTTSTKQFFAVGTYMDGTKADLTSSVTWSSSNSSQATVSNASGTQGLVTGILAGTSKVVATYGSVSGNTNLTVNKIDTIPPTVTSVTSLSPTTIRVVYSKFVNSKEASTLSNYKVVDGSVFSGNCSDNTDFNGNSQTGDFSLSSISGSKNIFTIKLSHSQIFGKSYTLVANKTGIHDRSLAPNLLSCPNNADFTGKEQLKLTGAVCNSVNRVIVSFSKPLYDGKDISKSVECSNPSQCASRYKFAGVSSLGKITSAKVLDGTVCGGEPADSSKVCLTHTLFQSGGQYTVIAANHLDGDGFDNGTWGAIRDSSDRENLQSSPKDRTNFIGCGDSPVNFTDGPVATNPFGDDSTFGSLTDYNNQIYLGPNTNGNQAIRFHYNGASPESIYFTFTKDRTDIGKIMNVSFADNPKNPQVALNSASSRDGGIAVPNYVTIGHTGCVPGSADITTGCGPDNENGRGVFATGTLGETPHMFIAGSKSSGGFDYLYYSSDTDIGLDFKYIDMGTITGGATAGTSSIAVFDNRVYIGFAKKNDHSNAPDFGKITFNSSDSARCKIGNNCDAYDGYRGSRFRIDRMPYFGGGSLDLTPSHANIKPRPRMRLDIAPVGKTQVEKKVTVNRLNKLNNSSINWSFYVGVDSLFVFNGKLYAANGGFPNSLHNGSIIRSTSDNPVPCEGTDRCSGWEDIAPRSDPKWHNSPDNNWFSLELVNYRDLIPANKAFSQGAEFNGRMYITRTICVTPEDNSGLRKKLQTVKGCTDGSYTNRRPQLWKCDPALSGDKTACDANDWSVVGDDGNGFTNFGDVSNHSMTMLVASGSYLYVGFDNENGIQIWRTNLQNPGGSSGGWERVGGDGLGDTTNQEIYSGISVSSLGVNYVYVSTGKSDRPVKVYRQQNQ